MLSLLVLGKNNCGGCVRLNNEINDNFDKFEEVGCDYEYHNIDMKGNRDEIIKRYNLSAMPTSIIVHENDNGEDIEVKRYEGYVSFEEIINDIHDFKEWGVAGVKK